MRKDQVTALLKHAQSDLGQIEDQYKTALEEKTIPTSLQIDIKNMMENLRSALDYMANDIYETVLTPKRNAAGEKEIKKVYFPYGKTENDFKSGLGASLPKLDSLQPIIYETIEKIQPHKCGDDWLYQFCRIVNEKKHDTLTPQKRTERQTMTASAGGASVTMPINDPNFSVQQGKNCKITLGAK